MNYENSMDLVPLAGIFFIFGLPVLAWLFFRMMAHRERMEMLRQGILPNSGDVRKWAAAPGPAAPHGRPLADPDWSLESAHRTLRKGITLSMIGFALTIGLSFIGYDEGSWHPGPWLLGGLIPMFVGIAQVIIALLSGATFLPAQMGTGRQAAPPPLGGPPPPPNAPNAPPTYDSTYTYRPGDTPELRPPTTPPDRR